MCRRFVAASRCEVADVACELGGVSSASELSDLPVEAGVAGVEGIQAYPGSRVDVVTMRGGKPAIESLTWGFPVEWSQQPVFNTRLETAMGPNPGMWESVIEHGRCVVAAASFFESHDTEKARSTKTGWAVKRQYGFTGEGGAPLLLAAVRDGDCFSIVTTAPNAVVAPVHNRMPLVLRLGEARWWLCASWPDFVANWQKLANRSNVQLTATPEQPALDDARSGFKQESLF